MSYQTESSRTKQVGGLLLSFGISAALIGFLAHQIEWAAFVGQLGRVRFAYIPLLVLLFFAAFWIRAIRWRYLLPTDEALQTRKLFDAAMVGFFATCVLPFRAGEIVRPWMLSRTQKVGFAVGLSSIVTERVFDVLVVLMMLAIAVPRTGQTHELVELGAVALGALAGIILLVMIVAYFAKDRLLAFVRMVLSLLPESRAELRELLYRFAVDSIEGLRAISSFSQLLLVIFWSVVLWLEMALLYQVGLWTFGEFPSFHVGIAVTVFIALAVAAPSAPGFLGTFQVGCIAALTWIYGDSEEFALAYSVVLHAYQLLLAVISGAVILRLSDLKFSELWQRRNP